MKPEIIIESILKELSLDFQKEYRFNPLRRWRADYYIPAINTLLEIEGGVFNRGRHSRGTGYTNDTYKYNSAIVLDFKLLRYTTGTIKDNPFQIYEDLQKLKEGAAIGRNTENH
jgi:hypothetical protein